MITIPVAFRKLYGLKDGDKLLIIEDEGTLKIIPMKEDDDIRENSYTSKAMLDQMRRSKSEEIDREK